MRDDQAQLRDALLSRLIARPQQAWRALIDAGVVGMRVDEAFGGLGLAADQIEPVMEALGDACAGAPFLETSIIAAGLLRGAHEGLAQDVLRAITSGDAIVAVGDVEQGFSGTGVAAAPANDGWNLQGDLRVVIDAPSASYLLVPAHSGEDVAIFIVAAAASGLTLKPVPTIDGRMAADISLRDVTVARAARIVVSQAQMHDVLDEATAAICVEASALMRRLVRDTVAYAKVREQFGQAIGSFQAVQHRLVDMHIACRRAAAISRRALASLILSPAERMRAVSAAKVTVAQAARFVGQNAVQLHGGMGMTEELPIGRGFKRLTVIEGQLGSADHHLRRFMAQGS